MDIVSKYLPGDISFTWVQSMHPITLGNAAIWKNVFCVLIISRPSGILMNLGRRPDRSKDTFDTILLAVDSWIPMKSAIELKWPPVAYNLKVVSN